MEGSSKRSHHQTIHTHGLLLWAFIKKSRLLPVPALKCQTRKPRSWIFLPNVGMWLQITHSVPGLSNDFNQFWTDFIFFSRISGYATTSTEESVYIIGGWTGDSSTDSRTPIIAEYKNDQWTNVGNLNQPRHAHSAITSGSLTMVIGGSSTDGQP